ncbi:hypothetical protein [Micromonospora sp. NPDC005979]|uniref:hypothetical protein n=1 Tax=Micromonospora sp. NPDC005979 TaxID=3156726 RepID=UPI0033BB135A
MNNEAEEHTRRHRLVSRSKLEAQHAQRYHNPAVATYALAVREIVANCSEIGPIDTWRKLADLVHTPRTDPDRASRSRKQLRLRKKLSRHFTAESKGPPWQTVMLVVKYALPPEFRRERLAQFAELYELARGEKPPNGVRDDEQDENGAGEDVEQRLRQRIAALEQERLDLRVEVSKLRATAGLDTTSNDLPRQRDPSSGPSTGAPNARHFRAGGPVPGNHRAPRLDTGGPGLPGQSRGERPRLTDQPWHGTDSPDNLPRYR